MSTIRNYQIKEVSFESRGGILSATLYDNSGVGVVLCPPHPLYGGRRNDTRLVRIAKELASNNISALCIDYGSYGYGGKEVEDVVNAASYLREKSGSLGLLGYSFGAVVASNAATRLPLKGFVALSILRKVDGLEAAVDFDCSKLFIHGRYDNVAPYSDFEDLYAKAREPKEKFVLDIDHFYMENYPKMIDLVSKRICEFFRELFK